MAFLLDTNIISETITARPEKRVIDWLEDQRPEDLFLTAQTLGELARGAWKAKEKSRRERFTTWIERDLAEQFEGRVLPFDGPAAVLWGRLMGDGDRAGQVPPAADAQIAAVAIHHELTLATRNLRDFECFDLKLFNPWQTRAGRRA